MSPALHADEIDITTGLVRRLVDRALPHYAGLRLARLPASGSSNALFRLGEELLVRLPRQLGGTATIEKEARWSGFVGARVPVRVPEVVAVGEPDLGYPERWSVVRWLDGDVPDGGLTGWCAPSRARLALDLASVVRALRDIPVETEAAADPSLRWYRGEPLASLAEETRRTINACAKVDGLRLDLDAAAAIWEESLQLPGAGGSGASSWYHGDLVAENLLVQGGRLAAVLDFGGLGVGDPTVDLIVAWDVLDAEGRRDFRAAVGIDDVQWRLGRAWALALAVMTFPYYWSTMPQRCANRVKVARAVIDDARAHG